uniref:Uncharacterized protein n=1 Tax=Picea sitchensis TaxID=3332 RepID=A9NWI1_PICSI|nr:unknown [Picea sitchensis]
MAWRAQLSRYLKELRIHLCQTSPSSASTRVWSRKECSIGWIDSRSNH